MLGCIPSSARLKRAGSEENCLLCAERRETISQNLHLLPLNWPALVLAFRENEKGHSEGLKTHHNVNLVGSVWAGELLSVRDPDLAQRRAEAGELIENEEFELLRRQA